MSTNTTPQEIEANMIDNNLTTARAVMEYAIRERERLTELGKDALAEMRRMGKQARIETLRGNAATQRALIDAIKGLAAKAQGWRQECEKLDAKEEEMRRLIRAAYGESNFDFRFYVVQGQYRDGDPQEMLLIDRALSDFEWQLINDGLVYDRQQQAYGHRITVKRARYDEARDKWRRVEDAQPQAYAIRIDVERHNGTGLFEGGEALLVLQRFSTNMGAFEELENELGALSADLNSGLARFT